MKLFYITMLTSLFLIGACSEGEEAKTANALPAPTPVDKIEKADGVVYQDEIYANWPKH